MFIEDQKTRKVKNISKQEKQSIINFFQGSIYSWCNNNNGWFSLRDLMGKDNFYWQGTPLYILYKTHLNKGNSSPIKAAGKDAGWLLKKTIKEDDRFFDTKREDMIRKYKWNKKHPKIK